MTHELKCWPEYFRPIIEGRKRFEYRLDDRGYRVGDRLTLREWLPGQGEYTGHVAEVQVTYVLIVGPTPRGAPYYVVMSIELLTVAKVPA